MLPTLTMSTRWHLVSRVRSNELTYENICAKVKSIDGAWDKIVTESRFVEACAELMTKYIPSLALATEQGEDDKNS